MNLPRIAFLLSMACAACGTGARVQSAPPAAPATVPGPPPPVILSEPAWRELRVCVVDRAGMREVPVQYNLLTGDTVIDGRPFSEVYPTDSGYAAAAEWFVRDEMITLPGRRYTRFGVPRGFSAGDLVPVEAYRGVPLFAERGAEDDPWMRFVPVRPECVFQPYTGPEYGAVRG